MIYIGLPSRNTVSSHSQAKRAQSKNKLLNEADRLQALLLSTLAKEKVVQQALGGTAIDILAKSPVKPVRSNGQQDDMFMLPPMNVEELAGPSSSVVTATDTTMTQGSEETFQGKAAVHLTLHSIDVDSSNFKTLPADVRHEILTDIKETRKQSSWGRLHELPAQADNFSAFQMQRLLKRRRVQECLEDAEKEMGGQSLSVQDLERLLTEEGVMVAAEASAQKRIHSDDRTRFLLVSSIKTAMENALQQATGEEKKKKTVELGPEFDEDLKRAVQVSLGEEGEEVDDDSEIYMNPKQRSHLTEAAKEMARAYMMEYAGMSREDVQAILEGGGLEGENENGDINATLMDLIEKNELEAAIEKSLQEEVGRKATVGESREGVGEKGAKDEMEKVEEKSVLEIVIDPSERVADEEDLFADIFQANERADGESEDSVTVVEEIEDSSEEEDEEEEKTEEKVVDLLNDIDSVDTKAETVDSVIDLDSEADEQESNQSSNTSEGNSREVTATVMLDKRSPKEIKPILPVTPIAAKEILLELEKQKEAVTSITLDDLEVKESIIEISDSPVASPAPENVTPNKRQLLTDYFQTTPRKTPVKPPVQEEKKEEDEELPPYVKSPFFVKRTPQKGGNSSSGKKRKASPAQQQVAIEAASGNKATRFLFGEGADSVKSNKHLIQEASDLLRSQKSFVELAGMAEDLQRQHVDLEQERNKQSRLGVSVTERMSRECQDMLRLFGIPFIVAPMEAEAQCAHLNATGVTQGTVTDDSDVWLFGGATVYKNFFDQRRHVMEFRMAAIEQQFHVDRRQLIQLALLVGSDYTPGITGIGAVTGLEILAQFPVQATVGAADGDCQAMVAALGRFKEWCVQGRAAAVSGKAVLRNKLKNIAIGEGFPSRAVMEAYLSPRVDESAAEFSWGTPDVETIREFAKRNFGWTRTRTDELLGPVMKKLEERTVQQSIRNYFATEGGRGKGGEGGGKISKRVQRAIRVLDRNATGGEEGERVEEEEVVVKKKREPTKRKVTVDVDQPSTSKRTTRKVRIPETVQKIPQRDRTKQLEEERKRRAAELYKGTRQEK